jgi:copper chaperone CopZ
MSDDATTIEVSGLTGASAALRVSAALERHRGVKSIVIDVTTARARVSYDTLVTTPEHVAGAVESAGFTAHETGTVDGPRTQRAVTSAA